MTDGFKIVVISFLALFGAIFGGVIFVMYNIADELTEDVSEKDRQITQLENKLENSEYKFEQRLERKQQEIMEYKDMLGIDNCRGNGSAGKIYCDNIPKFILEMAR